MKWNCVDPNQLNLSSLPKKQGHFYLHGEGGQDTKYSAIPKRNAFAGF